MIAHVIPLRRFPRHLQLFDYVVPENIESSIAVGQLIQIPFRKSLLFGLVFDLSDDTNEKLKEIDSIICTTPIASKPYFEYIKKISERYATSLGHTANMGMLPLQKRKLSKLELKPTQKNNSKEITKNVSVYSSHEEHAEKLQSSIQKNTLIVVPEIYLLDEVFECLTEEQKNNAVLWHSELSQKEKFERWLQIRNSEKNIILSTRSGMLLPFPKLDTIIVDYEHDENHKQWDGTPRLHVKDITNDLADLHSADLQYMSYTMSLESYKSIQNESVLYNETSIKKGDLICTRQNEKTPTIVETRREIGSKHFTALIESTKQKIIESIDAKKHVFLFINRKGFAPTLDEEKKFGIGTETIEDEIKKLTHEKSCKILRIEKDSNVEKSTTEIPTIYIGTTAAFEHIAWKNIGFVGYLDIDRQISIPEFGSITSAWYNIQKTQFYRPDESLFYIQTKNPDHYLFRSLIEGDRFYRTELSERKQFIYAPYSYMVRYIYGGDEKTISQTEVENMYATFKSILTKSDISGRISNPTSMYEGRFRSKFWTGFIVRFDRLDHDILSTLHPLLGEGWIVDPSPISIISP